MTHRGPFQPLLFCDSVILSSWLGPPGRSAQGCREEPRLSKPKRNVLEC